MSARQSEDESLKYMAELDKISAQHVKLWARFGEELEIQMAQLLMLKDKRRKNNFWDSLLYYYCDSYIMVTQQLDGAQKQREAFSNSSGNHDK